MSFKPRVGQIWKSKTSCLRLSFDAGEEIPDASPFLIIRSRNGEVDILHEGQIYRASINFIRWNCEEVS
jgi:hypothetical protein